MKYQLDEHVVDYLQAIMFVGLQE